MLVQLVSFWYSVLKQIGKWILCSCSWLLRTSLCCGRACWCRVNTRRAAAHKHQDMRQKRQKLTSASWLRLGYGGFHNLVRFNCAPFFASCRRHRVLTVTYLDAFRCAAYLRVVFVTSPVWISDVLPATWLRFLAVSVLPHKRPDSSPEQATVTFHVIMYSPSLLIFPSHSIFCKLWCWSSVIK
jgi:hypothetical protein